MTTEKPTAMLTPRKVYKENGLYYVIEAIPAEMSDPKTVKWVLASKGYAHSTSAFAKLGRLYQKNLLGE